MRYTGTPPKAKLVDRPELSEQFADTAERMFCDGETLRIEFCVDRVEPGSGPDALTVAKHPVVRLVMPLTTAVEMINKLNTLLAQVPTVSPKLVDRTTGRPPVKN